MAVETPATGSSTIMLTATIATPIIVPCFCAKYIPGRGTKKPGNIPSRGKLT